MRVKNLSNHYRGYVKEQKESGRPSGNPNDRVCGKKRLPVTKINDREMKVKTGFLDKVI